VIVLVALGMVVLIGMAGLVIDVGYAYWSQRSLQASADAAALAGAQSLPNAQKAHDDALSFSGKDGQANAQSNLRGVEADATTRCLASAPNCSPVNAIQVTEQAKVSTIFARVFGIDSISVSASSTACSPCGWKPLDIMLVLDRTGSMCQLSDGTDDPNCTDLKNAQAGMEKFLSFLDPKLDHVGLAVFPPAPTVAQACDTPSASTYADPSAAYVVAPLSDDYTELEAAIAPDCLKGGGSTSYATAIEQAQAELLGAHGRADARNVIIFLSDGAANTGPSYYPDTSPYRTSPCEQGVNSAQTAAANGTLVYSIGYDLDALDGGANVCQRSDRSRETGVACPRVPSPISAMTALQCIASDADNFRNKPDPGQLNGIFTRIAADISAPNAKLIPDDAQ
jgi:Flp pilus assembly protein TadG